MRDDVYDYLIEYGFSDEELDAISDKDDEIYFVRVHNIDFSIKYIEDLGFSKKELISLININPFFLTNSRSRIEDFDNIYIKQLGFTKDEMKNMLLINPYMYILSPIDIDILINDLLKTYSKEEIRHMIYDNPNILLGNKKGAK